MLGRDRREARQLSTTYQMREKLLAIGDDFWVENSAGQRVYKVNGKALRLRDTLVLEDAEGHDLLKIQRKLAHLRKTMEIERDHDTAATVHKRHIGIRDRFVIEVDHGPKLEAVGNFVDHEYKIEDDGHLVAEVSKAWFRVRDTYGVSIADGWDNALVLCMAVVIDQMCHDDAG